MIDILIILLMVVVLILFKMWEIPKQIDIIAIGLLLSGICFYIARNVGDAIVSRIFLILGILSIFMIIFFEILIYIEKIYGSE